MSQQANLKWITAEWEKWLKTERGQKVLGNSQAKISSIKNQGTGQYWIERT